MCFLKRNKWKLKNHRSGGASLSFMLFDLANPLGWAHEGGGDVLVPGRCVFLSLPFGQNEILTSAGLEQDRGKTSALCWTSTSVSFVACNGGGEPQIRRTQSDERWWRWTPCLESCLYIIVPSEAQWTVDAFTQSAYPSRLQSEDLHNGPSLFFSLLALTLML